MIGSWLQYSFLHLEGPDRRMVWGEEELGNPTGCPADIRPCRRSGQIWFACLLLLSRVPLDRNWRNMLWDDLSGQLIVIDLEYVKLLKRRRVLESTSGNTWRGHCIGAGKSRKKLLST